MTDSQTNIHTLPKAPTITDIEILTKNYADARRSVVDRVQTMNDEIETVKRRHMRYLKDGVSKTKEQEDKLGQAITRVPELFEKPKSTIFHGIKVGFRKKIGKLDWSDDAKTVTLIRKHFPEKSDTLIKVVEKPIDKALKQLAGSELLKIGVTLGQDVDEVYIEAVDSDVDKLVTALLKDSDKYD